VTRREGEVTTGRALVGMAHVSVARGAVAAAARRGRGEWPTGQWVNTWGPEKRYTLGPPGSRSLSDGRLTRDPRGPPGKRGPTRQ